MKKIFKNIIILSIIFSLLPASSIVKSIIMPGWGEMSEYKIHNKEYIRKRANLMFLIETGIIMSYFSTKSLSNAHEDDYENYGSAYAGVDWDGKDDIYAINVGKFNSLEIYNEYKISRYKIDEVYPINEGYEWNWNSNSKRVEFSQMRKKSERLDDLATLMIAGILINRIASFFDVINIKKKEGSMYSFNIDNDSKNTDLVFNLHF